MTEHDTTAPPLLANAAGCSPAPVWMRTLALMLDGLLVSFAAMLIFFRLIAPQYYPNADDILKREMAAFQSGTVPDLDADPEFAAFLLTEVKTLFFTFLAYFAVSEFAWRGMTLGKRVFGLRAARWPFGEPPTWIEITTRCLIKSASLLYLWLLLPNALLMFFRPSRRCLHDYLARTIVTGDALPPVETPPAEDDE